MFVERLHALDLDVEVRRDAPALGLVKLAGSLVEARHLRAIQRPRRFANQLGSVSVKFGVEFQLFPAQTVRQQVLVVRDDSHSPG